MDVVVLDQCVAARSDTVFRVEDVVAEEFSAAVDPVLAGINVAAVDRAILNDGVAGSKDHIPVPGISGCYTAVLYCDAWSFDCQRATDIKPADRCPSGADD